MRAIGLQTGTHCPYADNKLEAVNSVLICCQYLSVFISIRTKHGQHLGLTVSVRSRLRLVLLGDLLANPAFNAVHGFEPDRGQPFIHEPVKVVRLPCSLPPLPLRHMNRFTPQGFLRLPRFVF